MHGFETADKSVYGWIRDKFAELLPRQATVVRSEGTSAWVRFGLESSTAPPSRFRSTVADVPVNTMGWVVALAGGKGLFIATGVVVPIPFDGSAAYIETTNVGTFQFASAGTISVPPGTYIATGMVSATVMRSSASSNIRIRARIGGAEGTVGELSTGALGGVAYRPLPAFSRIGGITFTTTGAVAIEIGVCGYTDAGSTIAIGSVLHGTLTQIS